MSVEKGDDTKASRRVKGGVVRWRPRREFVL